MVVLLRLVTFYPNLSDLVRYGDGLQPAKTFAFRNITLLSETSLRFLKRYFAFRNITLLSETLLCFLKRDFAF